MFTFLPVCLFTFFQNFIKVGIGNKHWWPWKYSLTFYLLFIEQNPRRFMYMKVFKLVWLNKKEKTVLVMFGTSFVYIFFDDSFPPFFVVLSSTRFKAKARFGSRPWDGGGVVRITRGQLRATHPTRTGAGKKPRTKICDAFGCFFVTRAGRYKSPPFGIECEHVHACCGAIFETHRRGGKSCVFASSGVGGAGQHGLRSCEVWIISWKIVSDRVQKLIKKPGRARSRLRCSSQTKFSTKCCKTTKSCGTWSSSTM